MIYIVMGVSGAGKTTIGRGLAWNLKLNFYDADDFHPKENIDKMANGVPLQDEDRWPWLTHLRDQFPIWEQDGGAVLACSALKESYREHLMNGGIKIKWIYLAATYEVIHNRIKSRKSHYMKASMLQSQFDVLEEPKYGIHVSIAQASKGVVQDILKSLAYE